MSIEAGGAETTISGEVSVNATWAEDIYFFDPDGAAMDISDLDFQLQFRHTGTTYDYGWVAPSSTASAEVVLSTDDDLSLVADEGAIISILRIEVAVGHFQNYAGDMIADLVAIDGDDRVIHYGHGVVSFRANPATV